MPRVLTPRRPASSTNCAGENVPSDAVVCECRSIIRDDAQALECKPYPVHALLRRLKRRMDRQLGRFRSFVRVGDAAEVFDLTRESFPVQALYVASDQDIHRTLHEYFHEVRDARANAPPHFAVG